MTTIQEIRTQTERKMTRSLEGLRKSSARSVRAVLPRVFLTPFMWSTTAPHAARAVRLVTC